MNALKNCFALSIIFCLFTWILVPNRVLSKTLIFFTQDFKPFSYLEKGQVAGPFKEIIDAVCKEAGFDVRYRLLPWRRAIVTAKGGKAQGLFVLGWNTERTEWLHFTYPVLNTEYGFFFNENDPIDFKCKDDLKGKGYRIGVYGPSNTSKKLDSFKEKITDIIIEQTPDDIACFKKLSVNRVQAVYSNRDVGMAIIKEHQVKKVRYGGKDRALKYYIGLLKSNVSQETFEQFNRAYKILYQAGKIKQIIDFHNLEISSLE